MLLARTASRCSAVPSRSGSGRSIAILYRGLCDEGGSRLHSSDIAFKPTEDGWGYTNNYAKGWDNIFKKESSGDENATAPSTPADAASNGGLLAKQREALQAAHLCGALSDQLFAQASKELDSKA